METRQNRAPATDRSAPRRFPRTVWPASMAVLMAQFPITLQDRPEAPDQSRRAAGGAGARTLTRDRVIVSAAAVVWVLGTLVGMGKLGGAPVAQQDEGLFSDHATLIAPHGPAFTIWPVIYCFLAA